MAGVKLDTQFAPYCFLGVDAALNGMRRVVIQRCSTDETSWWAQKAAETVAVARRGEQRVDELTYHSPYRRRRRPFAAGASPVAEACAAACKVDEKEGNCQ